MKTYEIEITQVDVFRVQAVDEASAIEHARGHKPDAPGCVLEVLRGHVSARAVHVSAPLPEDSLPEGTAPRVRWSAPSDGRTSVKPGPFAQGIAHP
jgi:hypothetical protein